MKIKKVEFSNINSLAGEWTIDFESPDFANSGMFCISGPTGSDEASRRFSMRFALDFMARRRAWAPSWAIPMR